MFVFDNNQAEASFNKMLLSKELQPCLLRIKPNQMVHVSNDHHCAPFEQTAPTQKFYSSSIFRIKSTRGRKVKGLHLISPLKTATDVVFSLSRPPSLSLSSSLCIALPTPQCERLHPVCEWCGREGGDAQPGGGGSEGGRCYRPPLRSPQETSSRKSHWNQTHQRA